MTELGPGPALLCLHETGTSGRVFDRLSGLCSRWTGVVAPDRRGWGRSEAPSPYLRTSIAEQARDAETVLRTMGGRPALVCGAGLGAVTALEAALAWPELVGGVVMVEPPLYGFLPEATSGFSDDAEAIRAAAEAGGSAAAYELFLAGELTTIGAGAERLGELADRSEQAPRTFLAELPAVPGWPFDHMRVAGLEVPVAVVHAAGSPRLIVEAAEAIAARLPAARLVPVEGAGLPHVEGAPELDRVLRELVSG